MKIAICLLLGAGLLAGCRPAPDTEATTAPAAPKLVASKLPHATPATAPAAPVAAITSTSLSAAAPITVAYRRYRGTVGGQPVTLELTIGQGYGATDPLVCSGTYTYDRHSAGQLLLSSPQSYQRGRPLQLQEADSTRPQLPTGTWQATQALGPVLTGTWRSPAGRVLPFRLREDYTDGRGHLLAAGYEVLRESVVLPCRAARYDDETRQEYRARVKNLPNGYDLQFLHLLGPDTLRPGPQAVQCPVPSQRRQLVRAAAKESGCSYHGEDLQVDYNAYGLLACRHNWEDDEGTARPSHGTSATVYDLRSGQPVSLPEVLRPGTDTLLQQLITRHLLDGSTPDSIPRPEPDAYAPASGLVPLPGGADYSRANFSLTANGLAFGYYLDEVQSFVDGGNLLFAVVVPYNELLPLLRSDSPVAHMLRERGLWRTVKTR
ncbi:MAG: hypothetical protein EOO59_03525 [Hymenobacter sp.]|nr:MAG: hypothetical protein EOO59_03525 [Hymenobacter sp.]